jgi:chlorite dismutase
MFPSATISPGTINPNPRLFHFCAGDSGLWRIRAVLPVSGDTLPSAARLDVLAGDTAASRSGIWTLRGVTSNERYVNGEEKRRLVATQEGLGRSDSVFAALIPIRKSTAWWALTQEQRREIFEALSHHTSTGLKYLPAIARRLHHCRDLSTAEPFDFLTWFEYRPEDEPAFNTLLAELRMTTEWTYVEREVDIRLSR